MADLIATEIKRVEVFEDRVQITRTFTLPQGDTHRLSVGPLSPLLSAARLSVTGTNTDTIVEEVRVVRDVVPRTHADSSDAEQVRAELEGAENRLAHATAERDHAVLVRNRGKVRHESATAWAPRALLEVDDAAAWATAARELSAGWARATTDVVAAKVAVDRHRREVAHLKDRLAAARQGSERLRSHAEIRVVGPAGAVITLTYTLPCAVWRPIHRARLAGGNVNWQVSAMVWNATGEDWAGVELVCSTARPGDQATPPVLTDDVVRASRKGKDVTVEAREEDIRVARESGMRATEDVPGVEDGGEARVFTAPSPVDLMSDGQPVVVPLEQWEAAAEESWVAAPEQGAALVRTTRLVHGGTRPLLAGPVELYGTSGALGRTRVGFVVPGEPFTVGWGGNDDVRIARKASHERTTARMTGKQTYAFQIQIRVGHLGREPLDVEIRERIPVSELSAVQINSPSATPALTTGPDKDGMVSWQLTLKPGATTELSLTYEVEASSQVTPPW